MLKKSIIIVASIIALLLCVYMFSSESTRSRLFSLFSMGKESAIKKLESSVDQHLLAISKFDKAYVEAARKLANMKALKKSAERKTDEYKARGESFKNKGELELAQKNEEQMNFYLAQSTQYNHIIEKRERKLKELVNLRQVKKEEIRLARDKVAHLKAMSDALDEGEFDAMLNNASELVDNIHHGCEQLNAEIEVMLISEE